MTTNFNKVKEFHDIFMSDDCVCDIAKVPLRRTLMREEMDEVEEALDLWEKEPLNTARKAHVVKELVDLLYVVYGTGVTMGWDMDAAFAEVQRSNLSKLDENGKPIHREDGKVLKGPNFSPANMESFVE